MQFSSFVAVVGLAFVALAHGQTVYLAGDSTMARNGGGSGGDGIQFNKVLKQWKTDNLIGWGQYLAQYLTIPVVNNAIAGRSSRSYTDEGRFNTLVNTVRSGDFVIIEFGHNDGSSGAVDNGRQCAVGDGYDTTATVKRADGSSITIRTFPYYIQNAVNSLKAKGAIPIVASRTPNNSWSNGSIVAPNRFIGYAQTAAARTGVTYIDHYAYAAQAYRRIGQNGVAAFYPIDNTHTSPAGANVVAGAFVRGLLCGNNALKNRVNSAGRGLPGKLLHRKRFEKQRKYLITL
ncbi:rhamnogalacturonan acetylesterase [Panaeolus papilionaceus]|nr:rhamnogalacturonan acetylesterase [Panaeolus papilionaceus]